MGWYCNNCKKGVQVSLFVQEELFFDEDDKLLKNIIDEEPWSGDIPDCVECGTSVEWRDS